MATDGPKIGRSVFLSFTTSMLDDRSPSSVNAGMNECLELGSGEGRANVRVWVWPYAASEGYVRAVPDIQATRPADQDQTLRAMSNGCRRKR